MQKLDYGTSLLYTVHGRKPKRGGYKRLTTTGWFRGQDRVAFGMTPTQRWEIMRAWK